MLEVAVSATTRPQRPGETDGVEYHFLGEAEFVARIEEGAFLEHVQYVSGKRYGTLRSEMQRVADDGRVLRARTRAGGRAPRAGGGSRQRHPLHRRSGGGARAPAAERATESTGEIGDRIALARHQLEQAHRFRYMVRNDDLARATGSLTAIVEQELEFAATMAAS